MTTALVKLHALITFIRNGNVGNLAQQQQEEKKTWERKRIRTDQVATGYLVRLLEPEVVLVLELLLLLQHLLILLKVDIVFVFVFVVIFIILKKIPICESM